LRSSNTLGSYMQKQASSSSQSYLHLIKCSFKLCVLLIFGHSILAQAQSVDVSKSNVDSSPQVRSLAASSVLELAERYYAAQNPQELEESLASLRQQWPDHFLRWEIESIHAQLNLKRQDVYRFALNALETLTTLKDQDSATTWTREAWPLVPRALYYWPLNKKQSITQRVHALIRTLPNPALRASLAWSARHIAHFSDDDVGYTHSTEHIGPLLPLSVIGTWDNDQGKGLDIVYPPEEEINVQGRYQGKLTEIGWRVNYPQDIRGKINLGELLAPDTWQIAYGASAVRVKEATQAELRISTTDPIKVWVNQRLVLSTTRVKGWLFDGITIPINLVAGVNQILIKSAQQKGSWILTARLTQVGGEPLQYRPVSLDTASDALVKSSASSSTQSLDEDDIRSSYEQHFNEQAPARRAFHTLHLLEEAGLNVARLSYSEQIAKRFPESLWLKVSRATALWDNGERGRAADLISELYALKKHGKLAYFVDLQARFWRQQRLAIKARDAARDLVNKQPKLAAAHRLLASLLNSKGWHEERCQSLYAAEELISSDRMLQAGLAQCEAKVGRQTRSQIRKRLIWSAYPTLASSLNERFMSARIRHDLAAMISISKECLRAWPQRAKCYRQHAQALWASERISDAFKALDNWQNLNPLAAGSFKVQGEWLLVLNRKEEAIKAWEVAINLDPNDQDLALRLSELKPRGSEPWLADVPSDEQIEATVKLRTQIKPAEGADQVYLMDDEVTLLKPDGSTESITTRVIHALNQEGRDDLTKMYVGRGRTQLMAAYALSPNGERVEASSIRKGIVRFRQLKVGSTVVLQHRSGSSPASYLVGHISKSWWFQNKDTQVLNSRWVLWMPKATDLKELSRKANALKAVLPMERIEEEHGALKRIMWRMKDLPPIPTEPSMPPLFSQVANLQISTVPSWRDVFKWERELLRDAFRVSPEVEKLSSELFTSEMNTLDRFYKIQDYVTRNIRYQQDYEQTIAGVKPHTAAQVLARQYGDCKDKAVLFITLAKTAGLKADFALVRTRGSGQVERAVPSQQFNHAIVYVPAQEGLPKGRFFDPTVDALDVQSLRSDDQGTLSLVYDPRADKHYWRDIPFQSEVFDQNEDRVKLTLDEEGVVRGELTMTSRGSIGQIIRKRARNPEAFKQVMQYRVNQLLPSAKMLNHKAINVDDLYTPAITKIKFEHNAWVRREGDQLRIPALVDWSPKRLFQLEDRRFPLVLGHKRQWRWVLDAQIPDHLEVSHLPEDRRVGSDCLSIERRSDWDPTTHKLNVTWAYQSLCERLSPQEYLIHRPLARQMIQLLKEEVVLSSKPQLKERVPSIKP
jgi:tetratricopeptide (TPR) repeat protein